MLSNRLTNVEATYKVEDVVNSLKKFRDAHVDHYKKAVEEHNKKLVNLLERALNVAKKGKRPIINLEMGLAIPQNMETQYNSMIKLFQSCKDMEVKLSFIEADGIFNDNWDWVRSAKLINNTYYRGTETFYNEANTTYSSVDVSSASLE